MTQHDLVFASAHDASPITSPLDRAVAAYLTRFTGSSSSRPPSVDRAIDSAVGGRAAGPILLNSRGTRMDRHAATRRLRYLAGIGGVRIGRTHPHMLRHAFVTTMLDAGVDLRDVQIAARHADPRTTRAGPPEPRPPPEPDPRAYMASST